MNKVKITKKSVLNSYKYVICVGYCDLQFLLNYKSADYYTCGVYGWNSDIYVVDTNTVICTGYRPFGNIRNYKIYKKYNDLARKVCYDIKLDYNKKVQKLDMLLKNMLNELL